MRALTAQIEDAEGSGRQGAPGAAPVVGLVPNGFDTRQRCTDLGRIEIAPSGLLLVEIAVLRRKPAAKG